MRERTHIYFSMPLNFPPPFCISFIIHLPYSPIHRVPLINHTYTFSPYLPFTSFFISSFSSFQSIPPSLFFFFFSFLQLVFTSHQIRPYTTIPYYLKDHTICSSTFDLLMYRLLGSCYLLTAPTKNAQLHLKSFVLFKHCVTSRLCVKIRVCKWAFFLTHCPFVVF